MLFLFPVNNRQHLVHFRKRSRNRRVYPGKKIHQQVVHTPRIRKITFLVHEAYRFIMINPIAQFTNPGNSVIHLLASVTAWKRLENSTRHTGKQNIMMFFIKAVPEPQSLFSYHPTCRNCNTLVRQFLFRPLYFLQQIIVHYRFTTLLIDVCQRRGSHKPGFLINNPTTVGKVAGKRIMQLVAQNNFKSTQQRMQCLRYSYISKSNMALYLSPAVAL